METNGLDIFELRFCFGTLMTVILRNADFIDIRSALNLETKLVINKKWNELY